MIKIPADIEKTEAEEQAEKKYRERIGRERAERQAENRQLLEDFKSGKISGDAYLAGVEKAQKEVVRKLNAEYRESSRDARDRTELCNRIVRMTSEMTSKLDHPTKNRHIPVDCIPPCIDR